VVTFDKAFNVFSGETGAGKSILVGGINAVLGGRVSKDIVRSGADKAVVTALFSDIPEKTHQKLEEYGYDSDKDNELILSREISESGNSVARVNGKPATAAVLREIAAGLIDVHGQHETRLITSREVQLGLLDSFGKLSLDQYRQTFREFSQVSKKLKLLLDQSRLKDEKVEILSARIADVEPYKLIKGEEENISRELNRLRNIKTLSEALERAYNCLNGTDGDASGLGAADLVNICRVSLGEAVKFVPECQELKQRLDNIAIELDDIKREISPLIGENADAETLPQYEERMSDFLRLRRKYGVDIDRLVEQMSQWQSELDELQGGDETVQKLSGEKKRLGDKVKHLGSQLSDERKRAADALSRLICDQLAYLDMPGIALKFSLAQDKVTITGMDSAEMLIAVNKGEEAKPLHKIASGGELSRIMLAIKSVTSDDIDTLIFDEIDSGISGRAAHKVGLKLSELSRRRQVLCVTHLAQIAAMADNHLLIEKYDKDGRTYTDVKTITGEQRKRELSRIISGDEDELSMANAERLIGKKV